MKKVTSTFTSLLLCLYVSAQVGALEPGFNNSGTPGYVTHNINPGDDENVQALGVYSDGRVVIAGKMFNNEYFGLVRYTTLGQLDATFGTGGVVTLRQSTNAEGIPLAITVLSDNKILVAGSSWMSSKDFAVLKLKENGTPDSTFGVNGWASTPVLAFKDEATAMVVQPDGKILIAGTAEVANNSEVFDFAVARFNANGTIDGGFGTGGVVSTNINANDIPEGIALQKDGKILVGGTSNKGGDANYTVVRYTSGGVLDGTYGVGGIATYDLATFGSAGSYDLGHGMAIQSDDKVILTGFSAPGGGGNGNVVTIRLTTLGQLDASFSGDGIANFNYGVSNTDEGSRAVALQSDGKIVVGGDTSGEHAWFDLLLLRYKTDGTLDSTFNADGVALSNLTNSEDEFGYALKLFGNRIYMGGSTGAQGGAKNFVLAVYQNDGSPLPLVLGQFYAQKQTNKVVLQWSTNSEEDVKQFVVERSSDGKTYKAIGTVAAIGNSSLTQKYSFADAAPLMGINNYYRLLMQDANGNSKYSKFLIVKFDGLLTTELKVNPSVVRDILQVQIPDGMQGNIGLQIIDMNGRVIKRSNIASDGNALNTTLDVSNLIKGVYILKASAANNTTSVSRFTKQ
jgi:uncharacterized delta-60 repeat protein